MREYSLEDINFKDKSVARMHASAWVSLELIIIAVASGEIRSTRSRGSASTTELAELSANHEVALRKLSILFKVVEHELNASPIVESTLGA